MGEYPREEIDQGTQGFAVRIEVRVEEGHVDPRKTWRAYQPRKQRRQLFHREATRLRAIHRRDDRRVQHVSIQVNPEAVEFRLLFVRIGECTPHPLHAEGAPILQRDEPDAGVLQFHELAPLFVLSGAEAEEEHVLPAKVGMAAFDVGQ